jgi:activator of 2-hydroxyglutaryl-CoA dehydratase
MPFWLPTAIWSPRPCTHLLPAEILMKKALFLGIDIGSTTLKAVLISADGQPLHSLYRRTQPQIPAGTDCAGKCHMCGRCNLGAVAKTLDEFLSNAGLGRTDMAYTVATGSQVVDDLPRFLHFDASVSEVSAHIAAASHYYANCRAILDVGGQDSKAMLSTKSCGSGHRR